MNNERVENEKPLFEAHKKAENSPLRGVVNRKGDNPLPPY